VSTAVAVEWTLFAGILSCCYSSGGVVVVLRVLIASLSSLRMHYACLLRRNVFIDVITRTHISSVVGSKGYSQTEAYGLRPTAIGLCLTVPFRMVGRVILQTLEVAYQ